jgi:hypothetical protein
MEERPMKRSHLAVMLAVCLVLVNARLGLCQPVAGKQEQVGGAATHTQAENSKPVEQSSTPDQGANTSTAQLNPEAEKIRGKVQKMGIGHNITVIFTNGKEYHGSVSRIDGASFEIVEVDLKQQITARYDEVKKVRGSYGGKNIYGKRTNKKVGYIILGGLLGFIVIVAALAARD